MSTDDDEVEREIAELRRAYVAELPPKVAALAAAVRDRDRAKSEALAHRLRGTAGSYGLAEVSALAGAIEDGVIGEVDWAALDEHVGKLTAAADR